MLSMSSSDEHPSSTAAAQTTPDDCYCGLWQTAPSTLLEQSVPPGYCGLCQICQQPGHLRHFPGPVPRSDAYCDRHYRLVQWLHPLSFRGRRVWQVVLLLAVIAYTLLRSR